MIFSPFSSLPANAWEDKINSLNPDIYIRGFLKILSKVGMIDSMKYSTNIPKIVSIVAYILGGLDLLRGVMHTLLLEFAAANIAGLDLSTSQAADLLRLMGNFGISNYITGIALILLAWKARHLALIMLGVIPAAYLIGGTATRFYSSSYVQTQANWGGIPLMLAYMGVCILTFLYGFWKSRK
jgi:hypothetical protein